MKNKAYIKDISIYLPQKILDNEDLVDVNSRWTPEQIFSKIGIKSRHIIEDSETSLTIALKACQLLIDKNPSIASNIDYILYTTLNHDHFMLVSSAIIQNRLKISTSCCAIDLKLTCSGYVQALSIAKSLIISGQASNILLVTSDTYSKKIHPADIGTRSIFGDAATATLISTNGIAEILEFSFGTDGIGSENHAARTNCLPDYFPDSRLGEIDANKKYDKDYFFMVGGEIFEFVAKRIPPFYKKIILENALKYEDISLNVFHQANSYIINYLRKKLGITREKFYVQMEKVGNTSTSSIPIALNDIFYNSNIKGNILLCSFGGGYTWGGNIIRIK